MDANSTFCTCLIGEMTLLCKRSFSVNATQPRQGHEAQHSLAKCSSVGNQYCSWMPAMVQPKTLLWLLAANVLMLQLDAAFGGCKRKAGETKIQRTVPAGVLVAERLG
jgi:hypothetical protein